MLTNGVLVGTICLPSGIRDTGMSLRLAMAKGMPMMVTAMANAVTTCPMAIQIPATNSQITFPSREKTPVPPGLSTTMRPKGHRV